MEDGLKRGGGNAESFLCALEGGKLKFFMHNSCIEWWLLDLGNLAFISFNAQKEQAETSNLI